MLEILFLCKMVCCQQKRTKRSLDIRSPRGWGNTYSWSLICQIRFGNCELSNMEFIDGVFSPPQVSQNNASSRLFGSPSQTMRHRLKSGTPTECRSGSSTAAARILPCFRDIFVQKANCICPNCKIYLYELQNIFATKDSRPIWPLCWLLANRPRKTLFGTSWPFYQMHFFEIQWKLYERQEGRIFVSLLVCQLLKKTLQLFSHDQADRSRWFTKVQFFRCFRQFSEGPRVENFYTGTRMIKKGCQGRKEWRVAFMNTGWVGVWGACLQFCFD